MRPTSMLSRIATKCTVVAIPGRNDSAITIAVIARLCLLMFLPTINPNRANIAPDAPIATSSLT